MLYPTKRLLVISIHGSNLQYASSPCVDQCLNFIIFIYIFFVFKKKSFITVQFCTYIPCLACVVFNFITRILVFFFFFTYKIVCFTILQSTRFLAHAKIRYPRQKISTIQLHCPTVVAVCENKNPSKNNCGTLWPISLSHCPECRMRNERSRLNSFVTYFQLVFVRSECTTAIKYTKLFVLAS